MKKTVGVVFASALLMACSGMQAVVQLPHAGVSLDPVAALEQACLLDPLNAEKWEQLGAALAAAGERERAAIMFRQAATLRAHDARSDYALLREGVKDARAAEADAANAADAVAPDVPRTQVRRLGAALVEVLRVAASGENANAGKATAASTTSPVRLEISNGNGVTGAAARLARSLDGAGLKTVRLSNVRPFAVSVSSIEYRSDQHALAQELARRLGVSLHTQRSQIGYADMRIVLGRDLSQANYLKGTQM